MVLNILIVECLFSLVLCDVSISSIHLRIPVYALLSIYEDRNGKD